MPKGYIETAAAGIGAETTATKTTSSSTTRIVSPMDLSKANLTTLTDAALLLRAANTGSSLLDIATLSDPSSSTRMFKHQHAESSPLLLLSSPIYSNIDTNSTSMPPNSVGSNSTNSSHSPPAQQHARRKASAPLIGANGQIQSDCLICSDRATGKHYGSISCDGCKGFFRRTIRKKHNYVCRFNRSCVVDKNQRNSCRRCRFEKCLANGMRPEAVQLERDRIAATRRSNTAVSSSNNTIAATGKSQQISASFNRNNKDVASSINNTQSCIHFDESCFLLNSSKQQLLAQTELILQRLIEAERILRRWERNKKWATENAANLHRQNNGDVTAAENMITEKATTMSNIAPLKTATTGDVTDSMHQQLILLVEWAKQLQEFQRLPLRSQIALLRHFSAQHLVICAAFRSLIVCADGEDAIWLANDRCVPRDAPEIPDVNRVVARILDQLTAPMRRLQLGEREFLALKAIAFFDPMAKDIDPSAVSEVEETRQRILTAFHMTASAHRAKMMPLRLANLLLLLPPLMAIARDLVEEAQLAKLFGLANVDELMAELLLPEDAETRSYSRLRTSVTSSIVQSNVTSPTPPTTSPHRQHQFVLQQAQSPNISVGSPQQFILAAPTPIYSPATPLMLQFGLVAAQSIINNESSNNNNI